MFSLEVNQLLKKANISDEYPEPFVKAITEIRTKKDYDFSVTELLKPLQAIYLAYTNDYEIDALNNTAALLGTGFHSLMEAQKLINPDDYIIEERFFKSICGMVISGQMDMLHKPTKTIWDYKTSGMYKISKALKSHDLKVDAKEWTIQTNCYNYLGDLNCEHIKVLAIVKDFKNNNTYGIPKPAVVIDVPVLKVATIKKWMEVKVGQIQKVLDTGQYPECTNNQMWNGIRCKDWCDVNMLCKQYQRKASKNVNTGLF